MCGCGTTQTDTTTQKALAGAVFSVEDMTCSHCAGTISKALKAGMPEAEFSVDLETQRVTVAGDAGAAAAIIRDAGYEPVLLTH